ncbi:hypothetical protein B0H16DRAFT_1697802 [Mycena metata]|uniref:F-box domain-containing protein n=1 Tax=Mycena metata TaxID=1033252 RepID=A0AAD7HS96_9AGAR|nr:hypothetical protein B0H16DRAFT_1697802 [Mycena metata]
MNLPPALSVTELEAHIAQISSDITLQPEVFKNLERTKSTAQRELNAIRDPVARLPLEISSEIFLGCLTLPRKPEAHVAPLLFVNICNAWTDIALSTPALWDTIVLYFRGADCLRSWLPRAGKRMLTIALYRGLDHGVAEVLSQHASQLKHLTLCEEFDEELKTLAAAVESFPQLDTLIIGGLPDEDNDYATFTSSVVLELLPIAPNLVELTIEGLHAVDSPGDNLMLSRLTSLKFDECFRVDRILMSITTPVLETLILPYATISNADFSLFFRRSSPPLQKLVLDEQGGDFDLGEGLMQIPPSVTHLELSPYGRSTVVNLFSDLQDLPSDSLQNLRTLILNIRGFDLTNIEPSWYDALVHFLTPRCTIVRFHLNPHHDIRRYADSQPGEHVCEVFRRLVDRGMQAWIGPDAHNYLPGWLQPPTSSGIFYQFMGHMVHRPADSRLLANLLTQEKEYAKHLATLLDHSNASLASVTAYASSSSPASAHLILTVAGSLSAADEALRHYAAAVDRWRDYLKGLKSLEDEVGNIMRDREILVTRLIKASKPTLHTTHSSSSLPLSPVQSQTSLPFSSTSNAKLVAAQTELQACEAHLAAKESALAERRAALVRDGLAGRCHALAECGLRWSEAGQAGAVAAQGGHGHGQQQSSGSGSGADKDKPLPGVAGSDVSLAPSQSASQINLQFTEPQQQQHIYSDAGLPPPSTSTHDHHELSANHNSLVVARLPVPPAHAMGDLSMPLLHAPFPQHVLARRITEEDLIRAPFGEEGEGSSAGEEDEQTGPLKVVENPRFAVGTKAGSGDGGILRRGDTLKREPTGTLRREATYGGSTLSVPVKSSSGFFGSIRGLFGRKTGGSDIGGVRRRWGKNKGREEEEDSDVEPDARSEPPMGLRARVVSDVGSRRLRRGATEEGARKAEEWVGAQGQGMLLSRRATDAEEKGWMSDGGTTPTGTLVKRRKSKGKKNVTTPTGTMRSVASAASSDSTAEQIHVLPSRHKRRSSLGVSGDNRSAEALVPSISSADEGSKTKAERRASMPVHPAPRAAAESLSLMSIVEGVARANRDGWAGSGGNTNGNANGNNGSNASGGSGGLVEVKAPRPDGSLSRGRTLSAGAALEGLPRAPGSIFSTPSPYSTPAVPSTFAGPDGSGTPSTSSPASSLRRPAKSPLRSALRNASPPPVPVKASPPAPLIIPSAVPVPIPVPAPVLNGVGNGKGKGKAVEPVEVRKKDDDSDDGASISSYETGHETFNEDGNETETERGGDHDEEDVKPPPPPPHEYPVGNGIVALTLHDSPVQHGSNPLIEDYGHGGSDLSASSASTQTGAAPQRRKSVRVSLQPTFSTTPPALDEETEDERPPWGRPQPTDMWEDSSEEDVEYQKAKKLLTRISRKEKKNR